MSWIRTPWRTGGKRCKTNMTVWPKAWACACVTQPVSAARLRWRAPRPTSSCRAKSTRKWRLRGPGKQSFHPLSALTILLPWLKDLPSERWRDKLCKLVWLCFSQHAAHAGAVLSVASVHVPRLQVRNRQTQIYLALWWSRVFVKVCQLEVTCHVCCCFVAAAWDCLFRMEAIGRPHLVIIIILKCN